MDLSRLSDLTYEFYEFLLAGANTNNTWAESSLLTLFEMYCVALDPVIRSIFIACLKLALDRVGYDKYEDFEDYCTKVGISPTSAALRELDEDVK